MPVTILSFSSYRWILYNYKKVFKAIGFKNKNDGSMELCVLAKESEKTCYNKRSNQLRGNQRIEYTEEVLRDGASAIYYKTLGELPRRRLESGDMVGVHSKDVLRKASSQLKQAKKS